MEILAIETSCDETGAAIISKDPKKNYVKILSNIVASSLILHSKTGGIIPEIAAREQIKFIIPVIEKTIKDAEISIKDVDAIAVTIGPGLIGSLLVGVETAKTLAYLWNKPIIPVNHLLGHIYANFIKTDKKLNAIRFPALALLVSGGHTDLVLLKSNKIIKWIGGTLDDAAGEAFDKIGRLLNLPYPGGPAIEKVSSLGNPGRFIFPRPMIGSHDFNFSFSGLKAAVSREVHKLSIGVAREEGLPTAQTVKGALAGGNRVTGPQLNQQTVADISLAVQKSIVEVLVRKTIKAAKKYNVKSILLGGGVASNEKLQNELILNTKYLIPNTAIFVPQKSLCTDNAAMIGSYATFNYKPVDWKNITANPELYFS